MASPIFVLPTYPVAYSITNINASATGHSTLYTTATLSNSNSTTAFYYPTNLIISCTQATSITVPASISLGTAAAALFNNIVPVTVLTGLTTINNYINIPITTAAISVPAGTAIAVRVAVAATGTSQTLTATLFGVYL